MFAGTSETFHSRPARYAKGMLLVTPASDGSGLKGRVHRLIEFLNGRYTGRERGYIMSAAKVRKLEHLVSEGWNATLGLYPWTRARLIPPADENPKALLSRTSAQA